MDQEPAVESIMEKLQQAQEAVDAEKQRRDISSSDSESPALDNLAPGQDNPTTEKLDSVPEPGQGPLQIVGLQQQASGALLEAGSDF